MKVVDISLFREATCLTYTLRCWSNSRKVKVSGAQSTSNSIVLGVESKGEQDAAPTPEDIASINAGQTEEQAQEGKPAKRQKVEKSMTRLTKVLLVSPEFDAIRAYLSNTKAVIKLNTVPSYFTKGMVLVKNSIIQGLEEDLRRRQAEIRDVLIPAFLATLEQRKEETAKKLTGTLFDAKDYPTPSQFEEMFGISWNWISIGVPENLPAQLRAIEAEKIEKSFADAREQITSALRIGWQKLVDHLLERLTLVPGEKPKTFKDTTITNIQDFLATFENRNIVNDDELAQLVSRAKSVIEGVDPKQVRKDEELRSNIIERMAEIKAGVDQMIISTPSRAMSFEEDEPEANE